MKAKWKQNSEHHMALVGEDGKAIAGVTFAWGVAKAHLPTFKDVDMAKAAVERAVGAEVVE